MGVFNIAQVRLGAYDWQKDLQMVICSASGGFLVHRVAAW